MFSSPGTFTSVMSTALSRLLFILPGRVFCDVEVLGAFLQNGVGVHACIFFHHH